jgi:hypothetical protein
MTPPGILDIQIKEFLSFVQGLDIRAVVIFAKTCQWMKKQTLVIFATSTYDQCFYHFIFLALWTIFRRKKNFLEKNNV